MSAQVPTLSSADWVSNLPEKADRLVSYYFVAEASQTQLYAGTIVSLPAQVQLYGHDEQGLRQKVQQDLTTYLTPYFDAAEVSVRTDLPNADDPNRINITVDVIVTEAGQRYSLSRLISTVNSKITQIVDINNNKGQS